MCLADSAPTESPEKTISTSNKRLIFASCYAKLVNVISHAISIELSEYVVVRNRRSCVYPPNSNISHAFP